MEKMHFSEVLKDDFEAKRRSNPSYSMSAYARQLQLAPSTLSLIFNKKLGLSLTKAKLIAKRIKFNAQDSLFFTTLVQSNCSRSTKIREHARIKLRKFNHTRNQLSLDSFKIVSDWYHFAIVELTRVKNFQSDSAWIAKRLSITLEEASLAIERLLRVGLLEIHSGKMQNTKDFYFVPGGTPSQAIQQFHTQLLQKAMLAVQKQTLEERYLGSSLVYLKKDKLPELKKRLQDFRRELCAWLEMEEEADSVYSISFQSIRIDCDVKD